MEGQYNLLQDSYTYEYRRPKRKCECTCFLLFVVMFMLYTGVYITALSWDGLSLIHPYSATGEQCGLGPAEAHPYLYFIDPSENIHYSVCVKNCDQKGDYQCLLGGELVKECSGKISYKTLDGNDKETEGYPTDPIWGVVCYPTKEVRKSLETKDAVVNWLLLVDPPTSLLDSLATIIANSLQWILPCGLCVLYFFLLRYLIDVLNGLVSLSLLLLIIAAAYATYTTLPPTREGGRVTEIAGVLLFVLATVYGVCAGLMVRRMKVVGIIVKLGCSFLKSQFLTILIGAAVYFCVLGTIILGGVLCLMTYFSGTLPPSANNPSWQFFFPLLTFDGKTSVLLVFEVQMILWMLFIFIYFAHMAIANSVAKWYYDFKNVTTLLQFIPSLMSTFPYIDQICFGALIQSILLPLFAVLATLLYYGGQELEGLQCKLGVEILLGVFCAVCAVFVVLNRFALINIMYTDKTYPQALSSSYMLLAVNPLRFTTYAVLSLVLFFCSWAGLSFCSVYLTEVYLGILREPTLGSVFAIFTICCSVLVVLEVFRSIADTVCMCLLQDMEDRIDESTIRPSLASEFLTPYKRGLPVLSR